MIKHSAFVQKFAPYDNIGNFVALPQNFTLKNSQEFTPNIVRYYTCSAHENALWKRPLQKFPACIQFVGRP